MITNPANILHTLTNSPRYTMSYSIGILIDVVDFFIIFDYFLFKIVI
jgi:hypothetical protein